MPVYLKRSLAIVFVAALLGGGWVYLKTRPIALQVCHPTTGTVTEFIAEDAKTRLDEEYIITMPIAGRVSRIGLEEGDHVTSGQVVARIDDFELRQQLDKLRAQVDESQRMIEGVDKAKPKPEDIEAARLKVLEAQLQLEGCSKTCEISRIALEDAQREFRRMEKLLAQKVVQSAQCDTAKAAFDKAREQLAADVIRQQAARQSLEIARVGHERIRRSVDDNEYLRGVYQAQIRKTDAEIALVRDQLAKTVIRAPTTGEITEKYVTDEQVLTAGTPLLKIGDMRTIEIESDILSEEIGRVRPGQRVEIAGKALEEQIAAGHVKRIYPAGFKKISALGIEQQRVKVIVGFDNTGLNLRPYVSVDLRIVVDERRDVLTAPEQAVFKNGDGWAVMVIEGARLAIRPVEIGLRNDETVEVVKGLDTRSTVVTAPTNDLRPGLRARPM